MKKKLRDMTLGELLNVEFDLTSDQKSDETEQKKDSDVQESIEIRPNLVAMATGTPVEIINLEKKYREALEKLQKAIPEKIVQMILTARGHAACVVFLAEIKEAFLKAVTLASDKSTSTINTRLDGIEEFIEKASSIDSIFDFFEKTKPTIEPFEFRKTPEPEDLDNIISLLEKKEEFITAVLNSKPHLSPCV